MEEFLDKFKFFFIGRVPSKANYKKISHRRVNGEVKPFIINNPSVLSSQKDAVYQFHVQKTHYGLEKFPIDYPLKASFKFLLSGRVKQRDIDNIEKFIGDSLEKAGIIKRDSLIYVKEKVEKRLGIKGFYEIIIIELEKLENSKVKEMENQITEIDEDLIKFIKLLNLENPFES
jgi:Holliday junction resolvase RusA-like endonuclease